MGRVLDVGCACGGLGAALGAKYKVARYTGIDINEQAIINAQIASDITIPHDFLCGDVVKEISLVGKVFDTVFNLSCADWNADFQGILAATWRNVAPGGTLIISLRLSEFPGERSLDRSYQFIHYGDAAAIPLDAERAAYVVLNVAEALDELCRLKPTRVTGYGYWGHPSGTARTPFQRLLFSVFAIDRSVDGSAETPVVELHFPHDIWRSRDAD
ncbi:MAG: class I SAM-dependent methyltransferase [Alphaproteobacteria bacterium]|nr:class I SAM-dependent methyltransferase [Alphaproteobacteria bacterium]MDE2493459.1 class I SAM-dependent methyltransferase [Alphaproteobacteria bacterium]